MFVGVVIQIRGWKIVTSNRASCVLLFVADKVITYILIITSMKNDVTTLHIIQNCDMLIIAVFPTYHVASNIT